jgi:mRNA-degrading endonuclease RelE of RelBE toxin-antitoxin system
MSEEQSGTNIEVFESSIFTKALKKLPDASLKIVEDEIDRIIADPEIGTPKKGDLSYLRVHKFKLEGQEVLLGYNWAEERLTLHLLNLGPVNGQLN